MLVARAVRIQCAKVFLDTLPRAYLCTTKWQRSVIAQAAIFAFDECYEDQPGKPVDRSRFETKLRRKLDQAGIPAVVIWAVIMFIVQKLLEYLWANWSETRQP